MGVLSSNPNQPFYYFAPGSGFLSVAIFDNYDNSVPPESVFEIPGICKSVVPTKNTNQKTETHKWLLNM